MALSFLELAMDEAKARLKAAERQRAHRQRQREKRLQPQPLTLEHAAALENLEAPKKGPAPITIKQLTDHMASAGYAAFEKLGGVEWLVAVGARSPGVLLRFLAQFVDREQAHGVPSNLQIVVQQLVMSAQPVPGVIASPVTEHISGPRLISNGGEVIDG